MVSIGLSVTSTQDGRECLKVDERERSKGQLDLVEDTYQIAATCGSFCRETRLLLGFVPGLLANAAEIKDHRQLLLTDVGESFVTPWLGTCAITCSPLLPEVAAAIIASRGRIILGALK